MQLYLDGWRGAVSKLREAFHEDAWIFFTDADGKLHKDLLTDRFERKVLSPEEGALLFYYCWKHAVAKCWKCAREYRQAELAADLFTGREQLCPQCNAELLDNVRSHLYSCSMLPAEVRRRAQVARETALTLIKRGRELSDTADVLMREAEASLYALQETIRELSKPVSPSP